MADNHSIQFPDTLESPGWWAVYTRHQHEQAVADMLVTKGLEVFLPRYEALRHWSDRCKKLLMPLFPCYLFVRERAGGQLLIMMTPGTHTIVRHGAHLAVISEDEMTSIQRAVGDPSRIEPYPYLRCGERVRVTRGSLQGVDGILIRKKNLYRLVLSVDMLAQSVAVEVDASDVEPISSALPDPTRYSASVEPHSTRYSVPLNQRL
jgi:transcription antitermination factor NusG